MNERIVSTFIWIITLDTDELTHNSIELLRGWFVNRFIENV